MEEQQEGSPLVGNRALVEVSTEAEDFTEAAVVTVAAVIANPVRLQTQFTRRRMKSCALRI
jgi:hypothetical protein